VGSSRAPGTVSEIVPGAFREAAPGAFRSGSAYLEGVGAYGTGT
jgi:hypothetical protein